MNGVNAEQVCQRWRHIQRVDHRRSINPGIEIRTPKDAGDAMGIVKTVGVVQLTVLIHFVVPAKLRPDNDACAVGESRISLHLVENCTDRLVRGFYYAQVFLIAVVTYLV